MVADHLHFERNLPGGCPDGTIYVAYLTGRLWAVRPDGSRKWIFRAGVEIKSSPAIGADGTIISAAAIVNFTRCGRTERRMEFSPGAGLTVRPR